MGRPLFRSPLEKVVQDPKLTQILEAMRNSIHRNEEFQIEKEDVCHVREVFCDAIEAGEKGLYTFTQNLADGMLGCKVSLFSEVWGRCIHKEHGGIQKSQTRLSGSFRDLMGGEIHIAPPSMHPYAGAVKRPSALLPLLKES